MPFTPATTDKFTKVGNPGTATTLAAPGYTIGNASINVGSTTNWPTDTLVRFAIDVATIVNGAEVRTAGTYNEFSGIVTSATTIGSLTKELGTSQNYVASSLTRLYIPVASTRENALIDGLGQDHNLKGNHKTLTDDNGLTWLERGQTASAVNQVKVTNAATGNAPQVSANGTDTDIDLALAAKGAGAIKFGNPVKLMDGWILANNAWVYVSATSFKITGVDVTALFPVGTKIRLTNTTVKYFYVTSTSFAVDTTVNITGGSDYSLANAAITSPYYSYSLIPQAFPEWFNYAVTLTGVTVGNGTTVARFKMEGRKVIYRGNFTLGSTSSLTATLTISLPVNCKADYVTGVDDVVGVGGALDATIALYPLYCTLASTSTLHLIVITTSAGTNPVFNTISSNRYVSNTTPITFGTADDFTWMAEYEPA